MNRVVGLMMTTSLLAGTITAQVGAPATPPELVKSYETLADVILGAKHTEKNLVSAIVATTYGHAEAALARARAKIDAGQEARGELERLAAYVAQLGNEGDAAVAGVRKRLLEGGHHHNAKGEEQGLYDEGFVIVTRAAKKVFLDAAAEIGKLTRSPDVEALDKAWTKVREQYEALMTEAAK